MKFNLSLDWLKKRAEQEEKYLLETYANAERVCAEFVVVNGVKVICGEEESKHTPEMAKLDVGMDHKFVPATWDAEPRHAWFCPKCGRCLVDIKLDEGEVTCCLECKIRYTIHGTGVDGSLFLIGAETLTLTF